MIIEMTTKCSECMHHYICKYANSDNKISVETENTFLVLSCSKFKQIKTERPKVVDARVLTSLKIVQEWRKNNPYGNKTECAKATGLSRPTVIRYWEVEESEETSE